MKKTNSTLTPFAKAMCTVTGGFRHFLFWEEESVEVGQ